MASISKIKLPSGTSYTIDNYTFATGSTAGTFTAATDDTTHTVKVIDVTTDIDSLLTPLDESATEAQIATHDAALLSTVAAVSTLSSYISEAVGNIDVSSASVKASITAGSNSTTGSAPSNSVVSGQFEFNDGASESNVTITSYIPYASTTQGGAISSDTYKSIASLVASITDNATSPLIETISTSDSLKTENVYTTRICLSPSLTTHATIMDDGAGGIIVVAEDAHE